MSKYVCVTCSSWFETMDDVKAHKRKKVCLQVVKDRADKKRELRAAQDAERRAKIAGFPVDNTEEIKPVVNVNIVNNTEGEVTVEKSSVSENESEININVTSTETETQPNESAPELEEVHVEDFKTFLVEKCDVKVQKVSRAKLEKLKDGFGEHIPAFLETLK